MKRVFPSKLVVHPNHKHLAYRMVSTDAPETEEHKASRAYAIPVIGNLAPGADYATFTCLAP